MKNKLVIFAKAPISGITKTRLIPSLGEEKTTQLAARLLQHNIDIASQCWFIDTVELVVEPAFKEEDWILINVPDFFLIRNQTKGDLGERITNYFKDETCKNTKFILIGTDCVEIDVLILKQAFNQLDKCDLVMHPAFDGGYTLIGFKQFHSKIFSKIDWSTNVVAFQTITHALELGYAVEVLKMLHDIDEYHDLKYLPPTLRQLILNNE
ncbi:MAG: hypothetical protein B7Z60_02050 [Ferrovum sp. 37-45-19]|uniref:TIGR04282 family arsenosugar biosynthesis glycosyltransferase n=1 Tax=Ferrovum sp. JA12 TaxID=1356299 RepID=UPI00070276E2|nr:TIGR04282 family arsenosugar biosynthesis glycosyltransferase [Ferrovum sp. JA12]OYV79422.1 MAG: hypothetical protein B7Z65_06210 [Ferrovum sp. 21-44-67]OYV94999.1 MAG: hypothetical protein B7Z60_02050 [Ferrovum sp. 37-45-19]OZB34242.1 MAG: hypothetical protein B7X47_01340 [Ferrovum sp. 34-44-207]HQT80946.1 TIGR04282 family arsenosugar biosynthesis glycosyltransferase [Ferrovaceae bacterium]KRH78788.1 hypothetical protein FERRO_17840 [Ferrovum sp. JA12]